jgi:putative endonuclease
VDAGRRGERIAADYLELAGCAVVGRNVRAGHLEIDLVVRDGSCLAFVEVKMRRGTAFGGAREAIHPEKLRRLREAARRFLAERPEARRAEEYRFDLVALDVDPGGGGMVLRHLRGIR